MIERAESNLLRLQGGKERKGRLKKRAEERGEKRLSIGIGRYVSERERPEKGGRTSRGEEKGRTGQFWKVAVKGESPLEWRTRKKKRGRTNDNPCFGTKKRRYSGGERKKRKNNLGREKELHRYLGKKRGFGRGREKN